MYISINKDMSGLSSMTPGLTPGMDITSPAASMFFLQTQLKSELLSKFQTDNPILNAIIALIILSSTETIIRYISKLKDKLLELPFLIWRLLSYTVHLYKKYTGTITTMIPKTATVKYITDDREINTLFEPINWYIGTQTDVKKEPTVSLQTTKNNNDITQQIPKQRSAEISFLDHKIKYIVTTELISIYADKEHKRENTIITMTTETPSNRSLDIFQQFSEMCQKKHQENKVKKEWKQLIYRNENVNGTATWKSQPSKTSRKLQTVVLKDGQMDDIINDINEYVEKESWYLSRDVPYTRRYMFHGVPGSGKSSLIKALACHLKRNIHYLILSEVKSDAELFKLFEQINFAETVLIIEDIDCATKMVHARTPLPDVTGQINIEGQYKDENSDKNQKQDQGPVPEGTTLTLSGILNAIDGGMIQNHGQIMIVTTNNPGVLDEALIRPGRIDRKFHFGNCDKSQIVGLFYNFFERYPVNYDKVDFPADKVPPCSVTSVLLQYKKDPDEAWFNVVTQFGS